MTGKPEFGVYETLVRCGRGAYGEVFLAENTLTGGRFALKVLDPGRETRELEGLIRCRECRHENLIRIHHIDRTADGRLYYTMDAADNATPNGTPYVPDTLALRLEKSGALPVAEVKRLAGSLLSGLGALHRAGLIHRDIKPENIIFVDGVPVLSDIGLAAFSSSASLIGTPAFIRPEVLIGKQPFDEKSDFYSLGMTVYCALTGWSPEKYPHLPDDLPSSGAGMLKFCRAACSGRADRERLRTILAGDRKHRRRKLRTAVVAAAAAAVFAAGLAAVWSALPARDAEAGSGTATPAAPQTASPRQKLSTGEWLRERDRLFRKYAIPEDFRAKCDAHYKEVQARMTDRLAQQCPSEKLQEELRRERMRLCRSDRLYRIGEIDDMLDLCLKSWDPELAEVTQAMLNGFEKFLRERYELYLAATGGK